MSIWAVNPRLSQRPNELRLLKVAAADKQVVSGYCYKVRCDVKGPGGKMASEVQVFYEGSTKRIWESTVTIGCVPHACPVWTLNENGEPECTIQEPPDDVEQPPIEQWVEPETTDETDENRPVSVNDPIVGDIAEKAVSCLSSAIDDEETSTLIRIKSAEMRPVTGYVYKLSLDLTGPDGLEKCNVVAMDQLWSSSKSLALYEWIPLKPWSRSDKVLVTEDADCLLSGEFHPIEANDAAVQDMALFAVSFLNDLEQ